MMYVCMLYECMNVKSSCTHIDVKHVMYVVHDMLYDVCICMYV